MTRQNHVIYRQILDISFSTKSEALKGQEEISKIYNHDLLPLINEIFDGALAEGESIRIDSLEIDIGAISKRNLKDNLMQAVRKSLEDELAKHVQGAEVVTDFESRKNSLESTTIRSARLSDLELFIHFVKTGRLPWWTRKSKFGSFEELTLQLIKHQANEVIRLIQKFITHKKHFDRFVHQLSDKALMQVLDAASNKINRGILAIHNDLIAIQKQSKLLPLSDANFRLMLWKSTLRFWLENDKTNFLAEYTKAFKSIPQNKNNLTLLNTLKQRWRSSMNDEVVNYLLFQVLSLLNNAEKSQVIKLIQIIKSGDSGVVLKIRGLQELFEIYQAVNESEIDRTTKPDSSIDVIQSTGNGDHDSEAQDSLNAKDEQSSISESNEPNSENTNVIDRSVDLNMSDDGTSNSNEHASSENGKEGNDNRIGTNQTTETEPNTFDYPVTEDTNFEINNAGLVIVWPFLPALFEGLGLVKDKAFVTEDAAQRAALVLQYIVTEAEEAPEYDLILNKLLCGMDISEPLPASIQLSQVEKEEINHLLETIADQWKALKGTSVTGLRQTFLKKDGILSKNMNGWKLTIERSTLDVLVDRLPWSISMIKLPWCDKMIHVEW